MENAIKPPNWGIVGEVKKRVSMPDFVLFDPLKWTVPERPEKVFTIVHTSNFDRVVEDVFAFCIDARNYQKIFPEPIEAVQGYPELIVRHNHVYSFKHWMKGFVPVVWEVYISEYEENKRYVDMQLKGFFKYFKHEHECQKDGNKTIYTDKVEFRSYFPEFVDQHITTWELGRVFKQRHINMKRLLENE